MGVHRRSMLGMLTPLHIVVFVGALAVGWTMMNGGLSPSNSE